jgi:hypothetical protein
LKKGSTGDEDGDGCVGVKFQVVIHFDEYPEDFSMSLVNDVNNHSVWSSDDPQRRWGKEYSGTAVSAGVCLPRNWCWVLKVNDKYGDG